jgi:hypothetical protein
MNIKQAGMFFHWDSSPNVHWVMSPLNVLPPLGGFIDRGAQPDRESSRLPDRLGLTSSSFGVSSSLLAPLASSGPPARLQSEVGVVSVGLLLFAIVKTPLVYFVSNGTHRLP